MSVSRSDHDALRAIAFALRMTGANVADDLPTAVRKTLRALTSASGTPLSFAELQHRAHDGLRDLRSRSQTPADIRRVMLLERCDVAGEIHKAVAQNLSLSRSQFYRDLQTARTAILRWIQRSVEREACTTAIEPFGMDVSTIRALHSCGRTGDAIAAAIALADRERGANALLARGLAVELLAENHQIDRARRERATMVGLTSTSETCAQAVAAHAIADAHIAFARQDPGMEAAARRALVAASALSDRQGRAEAEAVATVLLARALLESNDLTAGHAVLDSYERRTAATTVRPSLRASLIAARSCLHQFEPWALPECYEQARRLLSCAASNELLRPGIDAMIDFATLLCKQEKLALAEPYARVALANARSAGSPDQVATALATMSVVLVESGRVGQALDAATAIETHVGATGVWAIQGALLRSLALLRLGRLDEALPLCQRVVNDAGAIGDASALGVSKRIMAEVYHAKGDRRRALLAADDSVSLLEHVARPYMLSRSYAVSFALTRNSRHSERARSMREALTSFDSSPYLANERA